MIHACELVRDYDRAAQWCRRLEEWSARMRVEFLNRSCRATYAGILVWRGTWEKAERELVECADRLAVIRPLMVADATVRLGELRRREGRLEEAAEIFEQTAEHPLALLGLAEICLDQGDAARARDRAEQYLREAPPHAVTLRSAGLELLVRAQAALGEQGRATAALEELDGVAELVATTPLRDAAVSPSRGAVRGSAGSHRAGPRPGRTVPRLRRHSGSAGRGHLTTPDRRSR